MLPYNGLFVSTDTGKGFKMLNLTHAQRSELEQILAELDVEEPGNSLSDWIRVMVLGDVTPLLPKPEVKRHA